MPLPKFKFFWRRPASKRWNGKTIQTTTPQAAVEALQHHLASCHSLLPEQVEVDHFFFRRVGKAEAEMMTMLRMKTPFPVVFRNEVWQPDCYPEYPAGNREVFN